MFGGKRIDRARDTQRVREIQDLIRTIAGDVHENGKEMEQVKAMMKANRPPAPPKETPPPAPKPEPEPPRTVPPPYQPPRAPPVEPRAPPQPPVYQPPVRERPIFCIHCGSRLPPDGFGCPVCAARNSRICPNCGTRVNATMVTCPVCRRVMPPVVPYQRH